ncbi:MAG: chemotaxis protein CheA [Cytophagales bacterium]|nr:chemotaxis protein CheA [Cytophagales bacterium]MDW8385178.1 chemotaxis protein CheA [Flammeovirgaceae bacterium]
MQSHDLRDIFLEEARQQYDELNKLLAELEKNQQESKIIQAIFRIIHTLKGNAAAMGFEAIAELCHILEDIFSTIKTKNIPLNADFFNDIFRANDKIGELIESIASGQKVNYKGIKTRLEVIFQNLCNTSAEKTLVEQVPLNNSNETQPSSPEELQPEISLSDTIKIPIRKLDHLLNLVGELIIERDRLMQSLGNQTRSNEFARLMRISSEIQYSVMDIRLVQVGILFQKFYRIVRDAATLEKKEVNLTLQGTEIEIDRTILQTISDSLVHLVRNAVSHGIEMPEERIRMGKNPTGNILLSAHADKDSVIIEVLDDGKGINPSLIRKKAIEKGIISAEQAEKLSDEDSLQIIFESGFSSAEKITEISGRGVGMDAVRKAVESIGGKIHIRTKIGEGTSFRLRVPSSMAVKTVLLFQLDNVTYAIPIAFTESVISLPMSSCHKVGKWYIGEYQSKNLLLLPLKEKLHQNSNSWKTDKLTVIVVSLDGKYIGIVVDKLLHQKEIMEKPLTAPLEHIRYISGASIMGNGEVCLVLDVPDLMSIIAQAS